MERQRRRGPACGPLVLVLALFVPMAPAAHAQAAPVSTVDVGGVVTSRAGVPLEGATVTVEQTRFTTDAAGRWQGRVPFVRLFHEWASAPGYRGDRLTTFTVTPPGGAMTRLVDALPSVFEPDPRYATLPDTTPPTITTFATDAGVANAQELPVDTQLLTVASRARSAATKAVLSSAGTPTWRTRTTRWSRPRCTWTARRSRSRSLWRRGLASTRWR